LSEEVRVLSEDTAVFLAKGWEPRKNPLSQGWSTLTHHGRPLLMELACFPDSVLGSEVEKRYGKGSCIRISDWNGGDLETPEGVQLTKTMVKRHRPVHLWISCECGPFSPLQRINRRNPEQIQRLDEKQAKARKQYQGAIQVADFAASLGTQVHWELSERCEAWHLPEIESFVQRHQLQKVTCSGCAVGLRTIDKQKLLCKGWTVASKHSILL
jgi:ribosomal protein L34E